MPAHPKNPAHVASRTRAARITPAEDAALEQLLARRARDLEARSEPGDPSFAGWLRWIIRREAKAADIALDVAHATPKRASSPKRRRGTA